MNQIQRQQFGQQAFQDKDFYCSLSIWYPISVFLSETKLDVHFLAPSSKSEHKRVSSQVNGIHLEPEESEGGILSLFKHQQAEQSGLQSFVLWSCQFS